MLKHLFYALGAAPVDGENRGAEGTHLILKEGILLDDTVYNNIRIACLSATEMEILEAADKARVLDFAWDWSDGIDTLIGRGGVELTALQRDCILKARIALLKKRANNAHKS